MRQIVLDTETTGLEAKQGHRIIEVGCLEIINRRITNSSLHYYINPQRAIDAGAEAIHGISGDFLLDKPIFLEVAESLFDYIKGAELIIHNATFDLSFLNAEFARSKLKITDITQHCAVIDTLMLARKKHPGQKNNLDALCKRYNIDNRHRNLHGAMLDARLLAGVYLAMTSGQSEMFAENTLIQQEQTETISTQNEQFTAAEYKLIVSHLTPEEQQEHDAYLTLLSKASGSTVCWIE